MSRCEDLVLNEPASGKRALWVGISSTVGLARPEGIRPGPGPPTPESRRGRQKSISPSRQWFSKVESAPMRAFEGIHPLEHSGVVALGRRTWMKAAGRFFIIAGYAPCNMSTSLFGFGFRVSGSWIRVSRSEFRDPGSEFPVSGVGILVWGFGFVDPGFGLRISGFEIWVSSSGFRDPGFGFQFLGSGMQVSVLRVLGSGFQVSGSGMLCSFATCPQACLSPSWWDHTAPFRAVSESVGH